VGEKKIPLIDLLCRSFPGKTRKELYAHILCGEVYINNEKICDTKRLVQPSSHIDFRCKKYVSRGGLKLEYALDRWKIDVNEKVYIDAGCSAGGFTDCLLQRGAWCVHAVDVGYNQLDYSLRMNDRVRVWERTNIMDVRAGTLDPVPHAGVCDLSFRSLRGAASHILDLVRTNILIALVKPQFEWKHPDPGFSGVIKEKEVILTVCETLIRDLSLEGVCVSEAVFSPVRGAKGNREIFFLLQKGKGTPPGEILSLLDQSIL
jgi:23S rRNA (cytidine1920-2'-O)/16S rRNA (cytidine1409-2'-O)-methyltransferase